MPENCHPPSAWRANRLERVSAGTSPGEVHHQPLIAIVIGKPVGGMAEIELVVGRELQLEDIRATLAVDLIEVLRPCITGLKAEATSHPPCHPDLE